MIKIIFQSVFNPANLLKNEIEKYIIRFGWILILIRWGYYSIVFSFFRDYKNDWTPFVKPPFGLTIENYAFWQSNLAILFGLLLMSMIACVLFALFRIQDKYSIAFFKILNILGFTFFLPFVILQPLDKLIINIFGWTPFVIIPLHTTVLVWEAIATVILIDKIYPIKFRNKIIGIVLQITIWILLCAIFWR